MSIFRKTSVSVAIMLVCIVLAVTIGVLRKPFYENVSYDKTATEQSIGQDLFEMTTYGKVGQAVYDVLHSGSDSDDPDAKRGLGIVGIVVIIVAVILVLNVLGGSKRK